MRPGFQQNFTVAAFKTARLQIDIGVRQRFCDFQQGDTVHSQAGGVGINGYLPLFAADYCAFTDIGDTP